MITSRIDYGGGASDVSWHNKTAEKMYKNAGKVASQHPRRDNTIATLAETATGAYGVAQGVLRSVGGISGSDLHKQIIQDNALKTEYGQRFSENVNKAIHKTISNIATNMRNTHYVSHGHGKRGVDY